MRKERDYFVRITKKKMVIWWKTKSNNLTFAYFIGFYTICIVEGENKNIQHNFPTLVGNYTRSYTIVGHLLMQPTRTAIKPMIDWLIIIGNHVMHSTDILRREDPGIIGEDRTLSYY